ncbi:MAG: DNA-directed RNA polymerase subunit omega, partial [Desulfatiglandales bacterium]
YNKFALVHLVSKRVLQLRKGEEPLVPTSNREIVNALREIAAEKVKLKEGDNLSGDDSEKESEGTDKGEDILDQSEELSDKT